MTTQLTETRTSDHGTAVQDDQGAAQVLTCGVCELDGGPYGVAEGQLLVRVHDGLHHGTRPTATLVPAEATTTYEPDTWTVAVEVAEDVDDDGWGS